MKTEQAKRKLKLVVSQFSLLTFKLKVNSICVLIRVLILFYVIAKTEGNGTSIAQTSATGELHIISLFKRFK